MAILFARLLAFDFENEISNFLLLDQTEVDRRSMGWVVFRVLKLFQHGLRVHFRDTPGCGIGESKILDRIRFGKILCVRAFGKYELFTPGTSCR